ncbi:MAG: hypothetical protein QOJ64_2105 [Acidobacteriota bacterium]|jgi:predicted GIY-YIG superfamily endonuclease|nr:hypothetical protein [Acidobacteriota bacterium]
MFCVYVLQNPRGSFYIGQTGDIAKRLKDHNRTDSHEVISHGKTARGSSYGQNHTIHEALQFCVSGKSSE